MKDFQFDRPIQTATAIYWQAGIYRTTLTRACVDERLGKAAYRSGDAWLIDTSHEDFKKWLEIYELQPRVKGKKNG